MKSFFFIIILFVFSGCSLNDCTNRGYIISQTKEKKEIDEQNIQIPPNL